MSEMFLPFALGIKWTTVSVARSEPGSMAAPGPGFSYTTAGQDESAMRAEEVRLRRAADRSDDIALAATAGAVGASQAMAFAPHAAETFSRAVDLPGALKTAGAYVDDAGNVLQRVVGIMGAEGHVLLAKAGPEAHALASAAAQAASRAPAAAQALATTLQSAATEAFHRGGGGSGGASAGAGAAAAAASGGSDSVSSWLRPALTEAQKGAGMAYDSAGNIVNAAGGVLARAGTEAVALAAAGIEEASRGAEAAMEGARAAAEGATPYAQHVMAQAGPTARLALTAAMKGAGIAYNEAGQLVSSAGEVLAQAGADAQQYCRAGLVLAQKGSDEAIAAARSAVAAGSPYAREALTEAQEAAGLAYNAAGQVVNRSGAVVAQAGRDAAALVAEGRRAAAEGAESAAASAQRIVERGSPYARIALTEAQKGAGMAINEAGHLVNSAGQYVDQGGRVISLAAAQAMQAASAASAVALPMAKEAGLLIAAGASDAVSAAGSLIRELDTASLRDGAAAAGAAVAGAASAAGGAAHEAAGAFGDAAAEVRDQAAGAAALAAPVVDIAATEAAAAYTAVMDAGASVGHEFVAEAGDFMNSDTARAAAEAAHAGFDDVGEVFNTSREALAGVGAAAATGCAAVFDLVKLEIVRDWFQTISLFFTQIGGAALEKAKALWGNLSAIIAVDLSYIHISVSPIFIYGAVGVVAVACIGAFLWLVWKAKKTRPDEIREGHEAVGWDKRAEEHKKSTKAIQYILTACFSLYLPVSRIAVQIFTCDEQVVKGINLIAGKTVVSDGSCSKWTYMPALYATAGVLLLGFTFFLPYFSYQLIKQSIPVGSKENPDMRYDEDGEPQEYTDDMYHKDVQTSPKQLANPYRFMYAGFERKWCFYKVAVMVFKFLLILPILLLDSNKLYQSLATLGVLLAFSILSLYSSPFISESADRMDAASRVTAMSVVAFALIADRDPPISDTMSMLINVINFVNLLLLAFFFVQGLASFKRWWKNKTGKMEFTNTVTDRVSTKPGKIIPFWEPTKEVKHRIWHPFWRNAMLQVCGEVVDERMQELIQLTSDNGRQNIIAHFEALRNPTIGAWRHWVADNLEGLDVFWDGVPADGHLDSRTRFGKMYIVPYPFHCVMVYDDDPDYGFVREKDFSEFVTKNMDPIVCAKRENRLMLRCLHGKTVHLEYQCYETHSVPDGHETYRDNEGNERTRPRMSSVSVLMSYHCGTFAIANNKSSDCMNPKHEWSAGFKPTLHYEDGHGVAIAPHTGASHNVRGSRTIGREEIGLDDEMGVRVNAMGQPVLTDKLRELLYRPENSRLIMDAMPALLEHRQEYRRRLQQERAEKEAILSSGFWLFVYDAFGKPRAQVEEYLQRFEKNPRVQRLPTDGKKALDWLYTRVKYVTSHPVAALWFTFVDDVWTSNRNMDHFKRDGLAELWDPRFPTSIAYKPMDRGTFEAWVNTHMSGCTYFTEKVLDNLYSHVGRLNGGGAATHGGMRAPLLS